MFGVLKFRGCHKSKQEKYEHRLHYCGTCKTMGKLYGQRTRFFLNNDAVFLAELLTELGGAGKPKVWQRAFQTRNCMAIPKADDGIPLPLQLAATATVVLTKFKLEDQIADGGNKVTWQTAKAFYSDSFKKATTQLDALGLKEQDLWRWFEEQLKREAELTQEREAVPGVRTPAERLQYLAQPTAAATGTIYRHSALCIGAGSRTQGLMERFGSIFGTIVYILDAVTDYAHDTISGAFNAVSCAFGIDDDVAAIPVEVDSDVRQQLATATGDLIVVLDQLPLKKETKTRFRKRLIENLDRFTTSHAEAIKAQPVSIHLSTGSDQPPYEVPPEQQPNQEPEPKPFPKDPGQRPRPSRWGQRKPQPTLRPGDEGSPEQSEQQRGELERRRRYRDTQLGYGSGPGGSCCSPCCSPYDPNAGCCENYCRWRLQMDMCECCVDGGCDAIGCCSENAGCCGTSSGAGCCAGSGDAAGAIECCGSADCCSGCGACGDCSALDCGGCDVGACDCGGCGS